MIETFCSLRVTDLAGNRESDVLDDGSGINPLLKFAKQETSRAPALVVSAQEKVGCIVPLAKPQFLAYHTKRSANFPILFNHPHFVHWRRKHVCQVGFSNLILEGDVFISAALMERGNKVN